MSDKMYNKDDTTSIRKRFKAIDEQIQIEKIRRKTRSQSPISPSPRRNTRLSHVPDRNREMSIPVETSDTDQQTEAAASSLTTLSSLENAPSLPQSPSNLDALVSCAPSDVFLLPEGMCSHVAFRKEIPISSVSERNYRFDRRRCDASTQLPSSLSLEPVITELHSLRLYVERKRQEREAREAAEEQQHLAFQKAVKRHELRLESVEDCLQNVMRLHRDLVDHVDRVLYEYKERELEMLDHLGTIEKQGLRVERKINAHRQVVRTEEDSAMRTLMAKGVTFCLAILQLATLFVHFIVACLQPLLAGPYQPWASLAVIIISLATFCLITWGHELADHWRHLMPFVSPSSAS